MKRRDYIRILMAPLSMLTVFACSPNQFQSTQEYDDVYFTSADRTSKPTIIESTKEIESSNEKAFSLGDYSSESIDPSLVSKYNNSQDGEVVYFEEGPLVTKASELNYDDFVYDYENENLAYYELPLDWNTDWDKWSFNKLMANDFQFQLAWYEQYYLNRDFRMNNYLSGRYGSRRNGGTVPRVGLDLFGASSFYPGFGVSMSFVSLNNFYGPSNLFWSPIYDPFWTYGGFYSPYYTAFSYGRPYPRYGWDRWNRYSPYYSYNRYYTSNYYYNNEGSLVNRDGRDVTRGARISSTSVSSVRTDAVNGSTPNTRSARYASDLGARGSRAGGSTDGYQVIGGRNSSTATTAGNTRSSRVNTNAYQFSNDSRLTRSNVVRSSTARSSRSTSTTSRVTSGRSSSSSSNLFSRSSSTRSATPTYSRSSSSSRSSGVSSSRSSSSSSRSSGVSSSRSSSSSSSRSSGTVSSSSSRSSSSSSRSGNTSSSSSSRSSSNSSSRSGRGN